MADLAGNGTDFYDEGYEDDDRSINNRITFSRENFYGRQDELGTLHRLYARLGSESQSTRPSSSEETLAASASPVVIISGYSGAGKSSLVERFIADLDQRQQRQRSTDDFLFLSSKFEELQTPDPLSVIAQAFQGLFQSLLDNSNNDDGGDTRTKAKASTLDRLRGSIQTSLGSEANALASIIPEIKQVLDNKEVSPLTSSTPSDGSWNRLQYLFQRLLKALCHQDCPLLMFIDDLQWADSASISLLGALLKDTSLKNFMFMGAMRGEEIDKDHPVVKILSDAEKTTGRAFQRIELLNLSIRDVGQFIADTLSLQVEECEPLTEFVYGKTRGNIFYAMQMLEELERLNLLYYSMISFSWEWNLDGAKVTAGLSENLDDAVAGKIQHAPEKMQKALSLASYTRSAFHVQTLHLLMEADDCEVKQEELVRLLDMAVLEGFLVNNVGSSTYRFAHDRIQQAAYSLVKSGQSRDSLRRVIGSQLFRLVENGKGEDWMLFVAADHLNSCSIHGDDSYNSLTLVRLNLFCGEKANTVAAYVPASMYLQLAMKNLRKYRDHWKSQYDLSLRLFRALCDVELCLGNFASGELLAREVIDNAQNLHDRLPTFLSLAVAKGRQERHAEAYELCLRALSDLKAVSPVYHTLQVLKDMHIIKHKLKKHSDCDILRLPQLTNERKKSIVRFLAEGILRAYYCGDVLEFMFCCLKSLRITFKYGLSATSAHAFSSYGLFLGMRGDFTGALRMASLSRQILARVENTVDSKAHKALTLTTISFYIEAWSCPREQILSTGHLAHEAGMESGNVDVGFVSWIIAHNFAYGAGYPLDVVEKTGDEIFQQLKLYSAESILSIFLQMRLPVRLLLRREKEEINWEKLAEFDNITGDKRSETYRSSFGYLGRLELAVYYGKLEEALLFSAKLKPFLAHEAMYVIVVKNLFYTGLTYSGLARKNSPNSSRYRSKASALSKEMEKCCRIKGHSPLHKSLIMKADCLAFRCKDKLKIASAYDDGISAAIKVGFLQDAALASEIAGEFFLSVSDHSRARQYICQAYDIYYEWGAMAKMNDLSQRHMTYFDLSIREKAAKSSGIHVERSARRNTVDLDLLAGPIPQTELPADMSTTASGRSARDRDELSILTDASAERGTQQKMK